MAEPVFITCPDCHKRFKGRSDLNGRRVRCPLCGNPFLVELDDEPAPRTKSKPPPVMEKKAKQAKKESPPPPPPEPPPPVEAKPSNNGWDDEEDDGGTPYTIKETKLQARCPNCAKEMLSEKAVICVYCGYNTMTREIGKTSKTFAVTGKQHFMHLLPGIGAVLFVIFQIIGAIYYCIVLPYNNPESIWNSEPTRMWCVIITLSDTWPPAIYAYNRLIVNPKPKEIEKDD